MRPARVSRKSQLRLHGEAPGAISADRRGAFREVYALVKRIPRGRVMTYGQIAELLESRLSPRAVGWAMHGCPEGTPWQRVVNASGGCSTDRMADMPHGIQRLLLEAEGVRFRPNGTLPLDHYRWVPVGRATAAAPPRVAGTRSRKSSVDRKDSANRKDSVDRRDSAKRKLA